MPERSRLLLVSADRTWLEALQLDLDREYEVSLAATISEAKDLLLDPANGFSAALIDGLLQRSNPAEHPDGDVALKLAIKLRAMKRGLPVVFTAPIYLELLQDYALSTSEVRVLQYEAITSAMIQAELAQLLRSAVDDQGPVDWAMVDIEIETEKIRFHITLTNGQVILDDYLAESTIRPFLEDWQRKFAGGRLYERHAGLLVVVEGLMKDMSIIGERLHQQLISDAPRKALEQCLARVRSMEDIHFRFGVGATPFSDVPFEALRDKIKQQFIRELAPLARRITLRRGRRQLTSSGRWPPANSSRISS